MPGVRVRILDKAGRALPPDTTGRIFVGSHLSFEGYTGGGSKDVVGGLMATGDLGHLDRWGRLFIEGREDDMIISGGENVFPDEIEECLADHHAVAQVAVIGVPDDEFGQRLKAFVVLNQGAKADQESLQQHVRERLARYKVPREIVFLPNLPRNATGKVLKRNLADAP